jgi:hypothetical protein
MKNRKYQFIRAVRLLAPGDRFILEFAKRVREDDLPAVPGGAALELVVALQNLKSRSACPRRRKRQAAPRSPAVRLSPAGRRHCSYRSPVHS